MNTRRGLLETSETFRNQKERRESITKTCTRTTYNWVSYLIKSRVTFISDTGLRLSLPSIRITHQNWEVPMDLTGHRIHVHWKDFQDEELLWGTFKRGKKVVWLIRIGPDSCNWIREFIERNRCKFNKTNVRVRIGNHFHLKVWGEKGDKKRSSWMTKYESTGLLATDLVENYQWSLTITTVNTERKKREKWQRKKVQE